MGAAGHRPAVYQPAAGDEIDRLQFGRAGIAPFRDSPRPSLLPRAAQERSTTSFPRQTGAVVLPVCLAHDPSGGAHAGAGFQTAVHYEGGVGRRRHPGTGFVVLPGCRQPAEFGPPHQPHAAAAQLDGSGACRLFDPPGYARNGDPIRQAGAECLSRPAFADPPA